MQYSSLLVSLSALALRIAAVSIPRQNPHIVDFRTYGAPGCLEENQGVYTFVQSDLNVCRTFVDTTIGSIFVVDITAGCSVYAYTDAACAENQFTVPVGIASCYNSTVAGLGSYNVVCA